MKRSLCLLVCLSTLSAARADLVIEQKIEGPMQNGNLTMKVKGEKVRVDMPGGPMGAMSTIMDMGSGDMATLMHSSKMAMKISGAQSKAMMAQMQAKAGPGATPGAAAPQPTATGKKEKVGEFETEIYTWTGSGMTQTFWIAKDFPNYAKLKPQLDKLNKASTAGMPPGMAPDQSVMPGLPVKTQVEMSGMKITTQVVSVKEEAVEDGQFTVPADYKEQTQPGLPGAGAPPPAVAPK